MNLSYAHIIFETALRKIHWCPIGPWIKKTVRINRVLQPPFRPCWIK